MQLLFHALRRLEYRGYDSAGISFDDSSSSLSTLSLLHCDDNIHGNIISSSLSPRPLVFRKQGNVDSLVKFVYQGNFIFQVSTFLLYMFFLIG